MRLTTLLGIVLLIALLGAVVFPVFASGHPVSTTTLCLSRLKQQALGHLIYAADADDRFPQRDAWTDALVPYVKDEAVLHDSEVPEGTYGYAFNGALSRARTEKLPDPVGTPLVYDSVNPIRNASDLVTSLPARGRHPKKEPTKVNLAYADGHAKGRTMVP